MYQIIKKIFQYPNVTLPYPDKMPDTSQFQGAPVIHREKCIQCETCRKHCPTGAIVFGNHPHCIGINYDCCIFCNLCVELCPSAAIEITHQFELAKKTRNELRQVPLTINDSVLSHQTPQGIEKALQKNIRKTFGRSLHIREVDAGSCNGCDLEINALNNPVNDLSRLGMHFVASPRHADMLLVTGTGTRNMELALAKTYDAMPAPKLVVAVGACASSGGIFQDAYGTKNGIDTIVPVDVFVPGCPPRPQAILYGILKAIDRIK